MPFPPSESWPRPLPRGVCYCGCGQGVPARTFWVAGHDKSAESAIIRAEYGEVADFVLAHGYDPYTQPAITAVPRSRRDA